MHWYVLRVKVRQEKKVSIALEDLGINTYCPMITEVRQWSDRKKKVTVPVFNSYVFVRLDEPNRKKVFQVNGVKSYLFWLNKAAVVRNEEIEFLKDYLSDSNKINKEGINLGDKIFISHGLFKGREGVVQAITNNRLQLLLTNLGFKVSLSAKNIA